MRRAKAVIAFSLLAVLGAVAFAALSLPRPTVNRETPALAQAFYAPISPDLPQLPTPEPSPPPDVPIKLQITSIGVSSSIETVGRQTDPHGRPVIGIPQDYRNAAWFSESVRPGEAGDAVLVGHLNWYGPVPYTLVDGIFARLNQLKVGDTVTVTDRAGGSRTFAIDGSQFGDTEHLPPNLLSRDGPPSLTLITCVGHWQGVYFVITGRTYLHAVLQT